MLAFGLVLASAASAQAVSPAEADWLSMNYYLPYVSGYQSEITNDDFFLTPDGRTNPTHELEAFQKAMRAYMAKGSHTETLCRFPARMTLMQRDPAFRNFIRPACADYEKINRPEAITSVSLVFASGYFDNPSSYYGHTMLKFDYSAATTDQDALDASLNYGANTTDRPSNPMYVINGIFGGYGASYKRNNAFLNTNLYTNVQVRDLWEYQLALTSEQRRFLVEHSWELMRAEFDYYFFNDNCAHRIARVIEKATGVELKDTSGFWLLPTQVVRHLKTAQGGNLIAKETYIPSLKTQFTKDYETLSRSQRGAFLDFLTAEADQQHALVKTYDPTVLRLLLQQLNLSLAKQTEEPKDAAKVAEIHRQRAIVLLALMRYPVAALGDQTPAATPFRSLAEERPPSSVRLDAGHSSGHGFTQLTFRAANNDLLDTPISGQEVSRFLMGGAQLEWRESQVKLRKLVVVDILNLNTNPLPESITGQFSWGMRIDYAPRNELCLDCSSAGIEGKVGKSLRLSDDVLLYGLGGVRLHSEEADIESYANLMAEYGVVANLTEDLAMQLGGQFVQDVEGHGSDSTLLFEARQKLSPRLDWRVNAAASGSESKLSTGLAWYFD